MKVLLIADIFGKTQALIELGNQLSTYVDIIDSYSGRICGFENEAQAYSYFSEHVGVERYAAIIESYLQDRTESVSIVAFSVGASALWSISESLPVTYIKNIYCFYGSQIRHHTSVTPAVPINLIFPKAEEHFAVEVLITQLKSKPFVAIEQSEYLHGFMNQCSVNFNPQAYEHYLTVIKMLAS